MCACECVCVCEYVCVCRYDALVACMPFEPKDTPLAEGRRNDEF